MITKTYLLRGVSALGLCLCALVGTATLFATAATSTSARPDQPSVPQSTNESPLKITSIKVTGNKHIRTKDILAAAKLKIGDTLTLVKLVEAQEKIASTGYFGFTSRTVDDAINISQESKGEEAHLLIKVHENPVVDGIEITGSGPLRPEQVVKVLTIKPGAVYNPLQMAKDAQVVQELYSKLGYRATVTGDCGLRDTSKDAPQKTVLHIPLLVTRIAEIKISGTTRVPSETIDKLLRIRAGDYFNLKKLLEARRRLINSNYFEEVNPAETDLGPGRVGITLNLVDAEKQRK